MKPINYALVYVVTVVLGVIALFSLWRDKRRRRSKPSPQFTAWWQSLPTTPHTSGREYRLVKGTVVSVRVASAIWVAAQQPSHVTLLTSQGGFSQTFTD